MGRITDRAVNAAGGYSYMTVTSDKSVLVEGCTQISECNEILVRVRTREFFIEVWGSGLKLTNYSNSSVEIKGTVTSIGLERRAGKH